MNKTEPIISVIDDDESVRRALRRLLRSVGYKVKVYTSARDFLDCDTASGNCVMILDIQMPEMDGFELLKVLSESGIKPPVIFITAHENPEVKARAMEGGAVAFLQKPFDDLSLLEAIDKGVSGTGPMPGTLLN